ncbi:hypothetical protein [Virgibacillus sp. Bac332]|uniref:hypothetical protein n=1 Tax=Virgibacillus sp. Bac332 TaxID=2419842 RepID=UPI000EF4AD64|nr:hypothetical protein [Virgibacillus sp. Bac332]
MNFETHFLKEDISKASEEHWRILNLLTHTAESVYSGDLDKAKNLSTHLLISIRNLADMSSEKYNKEKAYG